MIYGLLIAEEGAPIWTGGGGEAFEAREVLHSRHVIGRDLITILKLPRF